jgi:hypothetical protein
MVSSFHSENHETIPYGVTFMMHQHSKNEYDIVIINLLLTWVCQLMPSQITNYRFCSMLIILFATAYHINTSALMHQL